MNGIRPNEQVSRQNYAYRVPVEGDDELGRWAHKLLADIDLLEGNPVSAATECATALEIIMHYPCPLIEWKVLLAARQAALLCGDSDRARRTLSRATESLAVVADSIRDPKLRQKFLAFTAAIIAEHPQPRSS